MRNCIVQEEILNAFSRAERQREKHDKKKNKIENAVRATSSMHW